MIGWRTCCTPPPQELTAAKFVGMEIDPDVAKLGVELAGLAAKKSAASILTSVRTAEQRSSHEEQVNELSDVINELVEERGHLIAIAQAYREELESRRLSDADLNYMTTEIIPVVRQITSLFESEGEEKAEEFRPDRRGLPDGRNTHDHADARLRLQRSPWTTADRSCAPPHPEPSTVPGYGGRDAIALAANPATSNIH